MRGEKKITAFVAPNISARKFLLLLVGKNRS